MKNSDSFICAVIESKMKEIIDEINKKKNIIEQDALDSELRILEWIFYQVCSNAIKKFESISNKDKLIVKFLVETLTLTSLLYKITYWTISEVNIRISLPN
jgi:hypothetical protein